MRSISIMGPDGKPSPIEQDPNFNLAMSEEVSDAISEKAERIKQLKAHIEKIKKQFKEEVEDLKQMVRTIGEENLRLKKLLKEHQIEY